MQPNILTSSGTYTREALVTEISRYHRPKSVADLGTIERDIIMGLATIYIRALKIGFQQADPAFSFVYIDVEHTGRRVLQKIRHHLHKELNHESCFKEIVAAVLDIWLVMMPNVAIIKLFVSQIAEYVEYQGLDIFCAWWMM